MFGLGWMVLRGCRREWFLVFSCFKWETRYCTLNLVFLAKQSKNWWKLETSFERKERRKKILRNWRVRSFQLRHGLLRLTFLEILPFECLTKFMVHGAGWRMQAIRWGLEFWNFFAIEIRYVTLLKFYFGFMSSWMQLYWILLWFCCNGFVINQNKLVLWVCNPFSI